jgi:hypothetical protein
MSISSKKQTIPKPLRCEVWRKDYKTLEAECPICKRNIISADNFECGHIIAESVGGKTELSNLKAICNSCNKSMGIKNMNEFSDVIWSGRNTQISQNTNETKHNIFLSDNPTIVKTAIPSVIIIINNETLIEMYLKFDNYMKPRAHMSDVSMWYDNYIHICDMLIQHPSSIKDNNMNIMQCVDKFSQCETWYNTAGCYERGKFSDFRNLFRTEFSKIGR